jgi:hypothetical protein
MDLYNFENLGHDSKISLNKKHPKLIAGSFL